MEMEQYDYRKTEKLEETVYAEFEALSPVSYTHLDVYKRQPSAARQEKRRSQTGSAAKSNPIGNRTQSGQTNLSSFKLFKIRKKFKTRKMLKTRKTCPPEESAAKIQPPIKNHKNYYILPTKIIRPASAHF